MKIEFDCFQANKLYHGLDKLCLNNLIQDNTMMKDYLTYKMMNENGVPSPLVSFAYVKVNGEDWGLFLAVEAIEDSFLKRNYGTSYGKLYKPDNMDMGGGRGNGGGFNMKEVDFDKMGMENPFENNRTMQFPNTASFSDMPNMTQNGFGRMREMRFNIASRSNMQGGPFGGGPGMGMGRNISNITNTDYIWTFASIIIVLIGIVFVYNFNKSGRGFAMFYEPHRWLFLLKICKIL